jgi:hypothetical protein
MEERSTVVILPLRCRRILLGLKKWIIVAGMPRVVDLAKMRLPSPCLSLLHETKCYADVAIHQEQDKNEDCPPMWVHKGNSVSMMVDLGCNHLRGCAAPGHSSR